MTTVLFQAQPHYSTQLPRSSGSLTNQCGLMRIFSSLAHQLAAKCYEDAGLSSHTVPQDLAETEHIVSCMEWMEVWKVWAYTTAQDSQRFQPDLGCPGTTAPVIRERERKGRSSNKDIATRSWEIHMQTCIFFASFFPLFKSNFR